MRREIKINYCFKQSFQITLIVIFKIIINSNNVGGGGEKESKLNLKK